MSQAIKIRPATPADAEFVVGLVPSFVEFRLPSWRDAEVLVPRFREALHRAVDGRDRDTSMFIAEDEDEVRLGFVHLRVVEDVSGEDRGHVADLVVKRSARRMGVGRTLMDAAESWARERNLSLLSLEVWATNEGALMFYDSLGYQVDSLGLIKPLS